MPVQNVEIAWILDELADLSEIDGDNPYRVRAYRDAARTVAHLEAPLHEWVESETDLTQLPGIGSEIAAKIREVVETNRLGTLERLAERVPRTLRDLLALPGVGAKQVRTLHAELDITTLDELIEALDVGKVEELRGFGAKRVRQLREVAERARTRERRWRLDVAEQLSRPLIEELRGHESVEAVHEAGSLRRRCETIGDVDLVVMTTDPDAAVQAIETHEDITDVVERDDLGVKARFRSGLSLEARVVEPERAGVALLCGTGSAGHLSALVKRAERLGLVLDDDGLVRNDDVLASESEGDIYVALELDGIPPELREDRGEMDAAAEGILPDLVTVADVRGDLQTHTTFSDGEGSLREMAEAARARGLDYVAITDHSQRMRVANGLSPDRLREQIAEIDGLNAEFDDFRVLKSCEVDVLDDGSLDMPDDVLEQLDLVVASVHSKFDLDHETQTARIVRALEHPWVTILAHPTGRIVNRRDPYDVDVERVVEAAVDNDVWLEVNASPQRLDLKDDHIRLAQRMGARFVISTDAHRASELANMRYGVDQARRGWLSAEDVVNTAPLEAFRKRLRRSSY